MDSASPGAQRTSASLNGRSHRSPSRTPPAPAPPNTDSPLRPFFPGQPKSLSGIALRTFCLGLVAAGGAVAAASVLLFSHSAAWRAPFFLFTLAVFHFLEFWTTAERNPTAACVDSFLLTSNWPAYGIAHSAALLECLVVTAFFPHRAWAPAPVARVLLSTGLVLVVGGQAVRSWAMLEAGTSFNHLVQTKKSESHVLVTSGIYGIVRHPSYFGFFYWGLGTQLVLGNVVCFFAFTAVLWSFFSKRIEVEEAKLIEFFGSDYVEYRREVATGIPLIP